MSVSTAFVRAVGSRESFTISSKAKADLYAWSTAIVSASVGERRWPTPEQVKGLAYVHVHLYSCRYVSLTTPSIATGAVPSPTATRPTAFSTSSRS